jgi:hypothetical protein
MASLLIAWTAHGQSPIVLRNVTPETGIRFRHNDGSSGRRYIAENMTAGLALFDYNGDGRIDVYLLNGAPLPGADVPVAPRNALYRNDGSWRFTDVTDEAGVGDRGHGLGAVAADYDNDGDTDLFVCNDVMGNFLFENDGNGEFEEVGLIAGVAYNYSGTWLGSMGVDCGDYDNDGLLDFFMTDYQAEMPALYRNSGQGFFEDVTLEARAGINAFPHVNWGTAFVDFDNDGDRDLFIACGHLQDNIELRDDTTAYRARNILLLNTGDGRFDDVSETSGEGLDVVGSSRGAAFDDLDNDGDVDAVILNAREAPTVLRNESNNDHHWLQVRLQGTKTNRDGLGARVKVVAGDLVQIDEVHSGRGYQSHYGTRLHFGLGNRDSVDRIEVRWIGGGVDVHENVEVDRLLTVTEGGSPLSPAGEG